MVAPHSYDDEEFLYDREQYLAYLNGEAGSLNKESGYQGHMVRMHPRDYARMYLERLMSPEAAEVVSGHLWEVMGGDR